MFCLEQCRLSFAMTSYAPPVVNAFSSDSSTGINDFSSSGGEHITISGNNFGPSGTELIVSYGPNGVEYQAHSCFHKQDYTQLQCTTAPSTGSGHKWIVMVAGQQSIVPTTSVSPPRIVEIQGSNMHEISTVGGDEIVIRGTNFGQNESVIRVQYRNAADVYDAKDCSLLEKHKLIRCMTVAGYGENLSWQIIVDGQDTGWIESDASYGAPLLKSLNPKRVSTMNSVISLYGSNFGPSGIGKVVIDGVNVDTSRINYISHKEIQVPVLEVNFIYI